MCLNTLSFSKFQETGPILMVGGDSIGDPVTVPNICQ